MRKFFLSVLFAALTMSLSAQGEVTRYFFSPLGNGDQDGTSWENAAAAEYLGATLAAAEPGTEFYLMEGNYAPDVNTLKWTIPQGVLLKGGYPTTMTGTSVDYDYTLGGQSIISADLDGDGKGDNASYAFVYIGEGDPGEKSEAYYKDWKKTEIWGITFRDGSRLNSKYWGNMVFVQAAQVDFHFCRFLNNVALDDIDNGTGNGALQIWGSAVRCFDCIFRDNNSPKGSGAAFQVRGRQSASGEATPAEDHSIGYFERCEFRNNTAYGTLLSAPGDEKWGTYGGNCSIADGAGTVYLVNCLIADSKAWYRGVGIRLGGKTTGYFINNTFYNNPCRQRSNRGSNNGSAISAGNNTMTYFAGNIMVEYAANDDFTSTDATVFIQNASATVTSAGNNIFGTVMNNSTQPGGFLANDVVPTALENVNTIEKIYGENVIENKGGVSNVIAPLAIAGTYSLEEVKAIVATWPIDEIAKVMDLDKDQRGYTRAAATVAGSYDPNGVAPEGGNNEAIDHVQMNQAKGVYSLLGHYLGETMDQLPAGLYIVNGKKVIK